MTPPRGLSKSEIRKNEIATITGKTRNSLYLLSLCRAAYPKRRLQETAITAIRLQAAAGMRFHQAACV